MTIDDVTAAVIRSGVVAVLRAPSAVHFPAVASVLLEAGITAIEVTLTTSGALSCVGEISRLSTVGVGTVLTADQAAASVDAGAQFLVSPVSLPPQPVPFYPGGLTPTEIHAAHLSGAPLVKLFPAAAVGPRYLKDLHGPLPDVRIMPTGGIAIDDIGAWLRAGASAVGLGGPLLGDALTGGDLAALRDRARRAADAVREARA